MVPLLALGGNQVWAPGSFLAVQWLGLCALTAEGPGSTPGGGTKIPEAVRCNQKESTLSPSPTHINLPTIPWKEGLESNKPRLSLGSREPGEGGSWVSKGRGYLWTL